MDDDWGRVASWLERELALQGVSLRSLETSHRVNYRTTKGLLDGQPVTRRAALTNLANALGYEGDAIDRVLRGEEPVRLPGEGDSTEQRFRLIEADLAQVKATVAQIVDELARGAG